jgi:Dolichyl-phosphate-mannose-protein mannosyltransferase
MLFALADADASLARPPVSRSALRWLLIVGAAALLLRGWIAFTFPITGDEAFFYWWGVYPDWGYSDHPPMVGWLIAAMRALAGDTVWAIRLPVVVLPLAVGAALWWALAQHSRERAAWALVLYWLAPINWLNTLMTTDTPLIFWSAWSVAALARAESAARPNQLKWGLYAVAGLCLGCAFLSKYFAVLLGLAYLAYFLIFQRTRLTGFAVVVLCALPGPLINLAYNASHGWPNIMFNVFNRNEDAHLAWHKPLLYIGMLVYLITPAAAWLALRQRRQFAAVLQSGAALRLMACVVAVPLTVFALLAGHKVIGLHWVLAFYPFGFVLLAFALPATQLARCARGIAVFTALHVLVVLALYGTTLDTWRTTPYLSMIYPKIVRAYRSSEIVQQAQSPGSVLMADAYTSASLYGFARRAYMPVFGVGRFHARQDDLLVDFSVYTGQTIRIVVSSPPNLTQYAPYFDSVRVLSFEQDGVPFQIVEGSNFNYSAYRSGVLAEIDKRFYDIPRALPMTGCPFCERYCGQVRCVR